MAQAFSSAISVAMITQGRRFIIGNFGDDNCGYEKSLKCQRLMVEEFGSVKFRSRSVRHSSDRLLILSKCQNIKLTLFRCRSRIH